MRNIVDAIIDIVKYPNRSIRSRKDVHNRANQTGVALEEYVQDAFAGAFGEMDLSVRDQKIANTIVYLGNQNNPPDMMLKDKGDAIEVKKIEGRSAALALNSSYPKQYLHSNSLMISEACRKCESWSRRDMLYVVGHLRKDRLKTLALVYGEDYCADSSTYERIKQTIKGGVESIEGVEFASTKELGRVNRVDPLGITYLRVRGMWHIENPFVLFDQIFESSSKDSFSLFAVINKRKAEELKNFSLLEDLAQSDSRFTVSEQTIKNPDNPAQLRQVHLISYHEL